jgi:thioredoxin-related protein
MNIFRKLSISFLALVFSLPSFCQSAANAKSIDKPKADNQKIQWFSFDEAVKLNKKKPRKIFLDVYTDWCGWCKRYDATTFSNPVIADYINRNFYPVKFNAERKDVVNYKGKNYINQNPTGMRQPHELAAFFLQGKMSYPTVVFLNDNLDLISPVPGYLGPKDFEVLINFFGSNAYKNQKYEDYKNSFKGKITN